MCSPGYEIVIMGERDKMVPISPKRTQEISVTDDELRVVLGGVPGEKIIYQFYMLSYANKLINVPCVINVDSTVTVRVSPMTATCG